MRKLSTQVLQSTERHAMLCKAKPCGPESQAMLFNAKPCGPDSPAMLFTSKQCFLMQSRVAQAEQSRTMLFNAKPCCPESRTMLFKTKQPAPRNPSNAFRIQDMQRIHRAEPFRIKAMHCKARQHKARHLRHSGDTWRHTWLKYSSKRHSSQTSATSIGRASLDISATLISIIITWYNIRPDHRKI